MNPDMGTVRTTSERGRPTRCHPPDGWRPGRGRRSWLGLRRTRESGNRQIVRGLQKSLLSWGVAAALAFVWVPGGSCCCLRMSMFGCDHVTMGALSLGSQTAPRDQIAIAHQDDCCPSCLDITNAPAATGALGWDTPPSLSGASQPVVLSIARWHPRLPSGSTDLYHGPPAYLCHNSLLI